MFSSWLWISSVHVWLRRVFPSCDYSYHRITLASTGSFTFIFNLFWSLSSFVFIFSSLHSDYFVAVCTWTLRLVGWAGYGHPEWPSSWILYLYCPLLCSSTHLSDRFWSAVSRCSPLSWQWQRVGDNFLCASFRYEATWPVIKWKWTVNRILISWYWIMRCCIWLQCTVLMNENGKGKVSRARALGFSMVFLFSGWNVMKIWKRY